ncbi:MULTISPECIES: hypothetical protein [Klebsiella]|uniref:hypothetical protein n=1 Tax=Klebsiella TaxID=570 RepID=UPI000668E5AC|nr:MULTISPECIES: hypothetical protein [Klebsiella]MEC6162229.1 hypothetical protein [Klebsiella grimontii]UHC97309.1 hypothetical protein LUW96_16360 [Klebsiella pasteurii]HBR1452137.1 hypothetical protein [Klebsiella quasipneumoniae subsp. similipneumoniae]
MLFLYEVTPPEDNNDSEVKGAYEISAIKKEGFIASFDFEKAEEASQAVDAWLASQGVSGSYIVNLT